MRATIVDDIHELREHRIAGSIEYRESRFGGPVAGIAFVCPCGCGNESYMPIRGGGGAGGPSWEWDGNREAPTLTPSVFNSGMPCQWHGWLRAGVWEPC